MWRSVADCSGVWKVWWGVVIVAENGECGRVRRVCCSVAESVECDDV